MATKRKKFKARKRTNRRSSGRTRRSFKRQRTNTRRGKSSHKGRSGKNRGQTIRLVIEQAPSESSMEMTGRPTRKAIF